MLLHGISKEEDDKDETYNMIKNKGTTACDEISRSACLVQKTKSSGQETNDSNQICYDDDKERNGTAKGISVGQMTE
jgi:hypothetical protein